LHAGSYDGKAPDGLTESRREVMEPPFFPIKNRLKIFASSMRGMKKVLLMILNG